MSTVVSNTIPVSNTVLNPEIQRALEHAVVEANVPFSNAKAQKVRKGKNKDKVQDGIDETEAGDEGRVGKGRRKDKGKAKERDEDQEDVRVDANIIDQSMITDIGSGRTRKRARDAVEDDMRRGDAVGEKRKAKKIKMLNIEADVHGTEGIAATEVERAEENIADPGNIGGGGQCEETGERRKKKKGKEHNKGRVAQSQSQLKSTISTMPESHVQEQLALNQNGTRSVSSVPEPIQLSHPSSTNHVPADDIQASTAALLSAIMAAAGTVPETNQSLHPNAIHHQLPLVDPLSYLSPNGLNGMFPLHPSMNPYNYGQDMGMGDMQGLGGLPSSSSGDIGMLDMSMPIPGHAPLPLLELSFGSSDEVLKALQDLDVGKLVAALKVLGGDAGSNEAGNASSANVNKTTGSAAETTGMRSAAAGRKRREGTLGKPPPPVGQVPRSSEGIVGVVEGMGRSMDNATEAGQSHIDVHGHAQLLATKWMNAAKLAELVKTEGLVYKKGKFSATEEQQLKDAIETYRMQRDMDEEQLLELIFNKQSKDSTFWSEITIAVPQRPIIAVYHHVRRTFHPMAQKGKWTPEEDGLLIQAVTDLGQHWEKVSARVGRMSSDCRDRYRNHIVNRDIRVYGAWTKEEEDELTGIVMDMTVQQGKDWDSDVFWGQVSEQMGGKRGRQQCRIKWTDALSKTVKNSGQKPRWSSLDAYILVHKIDSLHVRDDTEIDWKTLPDANWNLWSAHSLQRRWLTMKRSIKGYEDMSHDEIMDILRAKKSAAESGGGRRRRERRVTSSVHVTSDA